MALKPRARVVAVYDIAAKAAPALEDLLRRELPRHISCNVLEVNSHAEQVQLEDEVDRGREQQGLGVEPVDGDAGEDGGVAGSAGAGEQEPGGGDEGNGDGGQAVLRQENRHVIDDEAGA